MPRKVLKEGQFGSKDNVGYSRDPFREIPDSRTRINLTFAAILYLLRAYSRVSAAEKDERSIDLVKWSLNDCFQSYQITWRLYQNSGFCHHKKMIPVVIIIRRFIMRLRAR